MPLNASSLNPDVGYLERNMPVNEARPGRSNVLEGFIPPGE